MSMFPLHFSPGVTLAAFLLCFLTMLCVRRVHDQIASMAFGVSLSIILMFAYDMGHAALIILHR